MAIHHPLVVMLFLVSNLWLLMGPAAAQSPKGAFNRLDLTVTEVRAPEAIVAKPPLVRRPLPRDLDLPERMRVEDRPRLTLADGTKLVLPLRLNFTISADRRTVLQHGDALLRMHPMRTDLFWIESTGKIKAEVRNRFDGSAILDMSEDGFTAIAGPAYFAERSAMDEMRNVGPFRVDLYSPQGRRIWNETLKKGVAVFQIAALPAGRGVMLVTAPEEAPLKNNALQILRDGASAHIDGKYFGVLQKVVVLGRGEFAFVQGSQAYGVIEFEQSRTAWRHTGKIRLIGPHAAAVGADGKILLLMTGERVSDDALYRWTLSVLDLRSGEPLGQIDLKGAFPGVAGRVFLKIEADSVTVSPGGKPLRISIRPR